MRHRLMIVIVMLAALGGEAAQNAATPQAEPSAVPPAAPVASGLSDLAALTRSCSMAALNAAARRAADVPTQGKYQFSYFNLISDSHHAQYEVHFTSNYEGESVLRYCVEIYCQQGWDPRTTKATITVMSNPSRRAGAAAHQPGCSQMHTPPKGRPRRP
jgi:hypothetical protein